MNGLISHIEFLLHAHDCIIIPDLGGFVLNYLPVRKDGLSVFDAPRYEITFNSELTHNDGLLAQSYMQTENISFQAAHTKIEQAVREMWQTLQINEKLELDVLGTLQLNAEKQLVFNPGNFTRPDIFGLSPTKLKPLIQVQSPIGVEKKPVNKTKVIRRIGQTVAAAAVIAFMMLVFPITDTSQSQQQAEIFSETNLFSLKTRKVESPESLIQTATVASSNKTETSIATERPSIESKEAEASAKTIVTKKYYVVVGVYEVRESALSILQNLKQEGFALASSHSRAGRTDVYAASFAERATAEAFKRELHEGYPAYKEAWILKY